jgi:hypothetical protein
LGFGGRFSPTMGPYPKQGEVREWPVGLVSAWLFLRSATPTHIDSPTLTLHHVTKCYVAFEVW